MYLKKNTKNKTTNKTKNNNNNLNNKKKKTTLSFLFVDNFSLTKKKTTEK